MKFSYNWISELIDGLDLAPRELERLITMKTAECEGIEEVGLLLAGASPARVVKVEPISNSHNRIAIVETERYGRKTVVCGSPNCREGLTTVYVPLGRKTIDGIESDGMLASGAELGVNRDHEGVIELPWDRSDVLRPDHIIEIDNKSITHRPDLWGHHGMAREVAAISGRPLRDPVRLDLLPAGPGAIGVSIADLTLCPRYSALVFENVTVRESPMWLQYRLEAIGLNPINNIVDFTNYVMAELGQPTHAFDRALLKGDTIFIRPARKGEHFIALNNEEYTLDPSNVVIADEGGAVALAGVIGGRDSAISARTTSIVLESACFGASSVRKTSAGQRLRTDASMRFEKSQDPHNTVRALARALELLPELSPGIRLVGGVSDQSVPLAAPKLISLPIPWLRRKLGRDIIIDEVQQILESLAFRVVRSGEDVLEVHVPSWRATKDVSTKDDLIEEVGRMIGYGSITPAAPLVATAPPPEDPERLFLRGVRAQMTAQGFTEVYNYSFVSEEQVRELGFRMEDHVGVANPIASDQSLLRTSLLPGILKNIRENSKHYDSFRLFEVGREIHPRDEITHLSAAVYSKDQGVDGLFEAKRAAECLLPGAEAAPVHARTFEHPSRVAAIEWRGSRVGRLFELHPSLVEGRAAVLDLDLRAVQSIRPPEIRYTSPRRYPSSGFDLSVIAGSRELVGAIQERLAAFIPADRLEKIEYLRQYAGAQLAANQKSVSFRVTVASTEKTLSSDEVNAIRQSIIDGMHGEGYELRV